MSLAIALYVNVLVYIMVSAWFDVLTDALKDYTAWKLSQP